MSTSTTLYTCEQATKLIVQKAELKLTLGERFRLWMHLALCKTCKQFSIQNAWMDKQLHKLAKHQEEKSAVLNESKKQELKVALDKAMKK